jgi:hypothetical protein
MAQVDWEGFWADPEEDSAALQSWAQQHGVELPKQTKQLAVVGCHFSSGVADDRS